MKIEKIKPIPKYIQKKIKLYDDQLKSAPFGRTRFYAYFILFIWNCLRRILRSRRLRAVSAPCLRTSGWLI